MAAIEALHIEKSFDKTPALKDISFEVEAGALFGLIGPDGAGKTTLFRIFTTLLLADKGEARVAGYDVVQAYKEIRKRVGYMPGRFSLYQDLTVEENLSFFATIFGTSIKANYELIRDIYVRIEPFNHRRAGQLSGGMKQKLALSCALIHRPEVLFLDEPTTGVDAVSRKEFWEMLHKLRDQGITILVSTPYMDEASQCDRIALIQNGRFLGIDTPEQLCKNFEHPLYAISASDRYQLLQDLRQFPGTLHALPFGESLHLSTAASVDAQKIDHYLQGKGHQQVQVSRIEAGIEDVFLHLMDRR